MTYEIDTNRTDVAFCICIISKSKQQTRFSDTGITDQKKFEQVITRKNCKRKESVRESNK